jgi:hypothetical protein
VVEYLPSKPETLTSNPSTTKNKQTNKKPTEKIVCKTLSQKYPSQKRAGGIAQGVGPELKP